MSTQVTGTASEKRRSQQREEVRRAILEATEDLLLRHGYERFSMRRLAARCGYTAPAIYHYFTDKGELLDALLEERFAGLVANIRRVPRSGVPEHRLRRMLAAFLRFGIENPTLYRLTELPRENGTPPESAEKARALLEEPLRALAGAGRLETDDLELALQSIWGSLHGLVSLRSARPDYAWAPELDAFSIDTLLRGLVRPARAGGEGPS